MSYHRLRDSRGLLAFLTLFLVACSGTSQAGSTSGEPAAPAPAAAAAPSEAAPTADSDESSTLDGVYTEAQAQRGRKVFDDTCSACHQVEDWQDDLFLSRWEGESVYRFWYYIYETMPDDLPPYALPREQVTDVMTYILQLNGLPSGTMEMGSDDDSIDQHWLRWGKG